MSIFRRRSGIISFPIFFFLSPPKNMQPTNTTTRVNELAAIISANTAIVSDYLSSHDLPPLTNNEDAPAKPQIPAHETAVIEAQDAAIAATQELGLLMKGPTEGLLGMSVSFPSHSLPFDLSHLCYRQNHHHHHHPPFNGEKESSRGSSEISIGKMRSLQDDNEKNYLADHIACNAPK